MRSMLSILSCVILSACATTQPPQPTKTIYRVVDLTPALVAPVVPTPPPDKAIYKASEKDERIKLLWLNNMDIRGDLEMCNKRLFEIEKMQKKIAEEVRLLNSKEKQ